MDKVFNNLTKDTIYNKLLCKGLFPEKLEGILSSDQFGNWIIANEKTLNVPEKSFHYMTYKITRNNNAPRYLCIPHPIAYINLCKCLRNNWNEIVKIFTDDYSDTSMLTPKDDNKNQRIFSMGSYDKNPIENSLLIKKQFGKKYCVNADISNFYPSIYTHSISWALVNKDISKKDKKHNKWFDSIDKSIRNCQDGESIGVHIGPDTSAIIAEIILSQIDKRLVSKFEYLRFIDDYKCFCEDMESAEKFICELTHNLEYYRLKLNTEKTKITEIPITIDTEWVRLLKSYPLKEENLIVDEKSINAVMGLMDLSIELYIKHKDDSCIKYALQKIKKVEYQTYNEFELIFRRICGIAYCYPYIIDLIEDFLKKNEFLDDILQFKNMLKGILNSFLKEHVKYGRSDVITWVFYYSIQYRIEIEKFQEYRDLIIRQNDPVSTLLCFIYAKVNKLDISDFEKIKSNEDDTGDWWLFLYEKSRILDKEYQYNKQDEKVFFEELRKNKISFLGEKLLICLEAAEKFGEVPEYLKFQGHDS